MTTWKQYPCDHNYLVGDNGEVFSKKANNGRGLKLKLIKKNTGYLQVSLPRRRCALVHRLVAETHLLSVDGKQFVNHKNGIRDDNRYASAELGVIL